MAADIFLKLTGIDGETKDPDHSGALEIMHWSWSLHQPTAQARFGGGGVAKVDIGNFNCVPIADSSAATLFQFIAQGDHINEAKLIQRKAGGQQEEFFKLTMTKCTVSNFSMAGSGNGIDCNLALDFEEVKMEVAPQLDGGGLGAVKEFAYNIATDKPV